MPRRGPVLPLTGNSPGGDAAFAASIDISPSLSLRLRKLLRSAGRLSGWRRQQRDPTQRPAKQPARQVTLCQEQPIVVVGMLLVRVSRFRSAVRHAVGQLQFSQCSGLLRHGCLPRGSSKEATEVCP
jgi:hypothetical protein